MTNYNKHIWWDSYTKILHIGKVMIVIGGFTNWAFLHARVDASKSHYFRFGKVGIRI